MKLPLHTERLLLRRYHTEDFQGLYELQSDPDLVQFVPFGPRTADEVREQLGWRLKEPRFEVEGGRLALAITLSDDGEYAGDLLLFSHDLVNKSAEIGYMLLERHQGRGYMTEAVSALLSAAFETYDLHRVVAYMGSANLASAAVAERVGMRREALHVDAEWFKGAWSSTVIYAVLRSEWSLSD